MNRGSFETLGSNPAYSQYNY